MSGRRVVLRRPAVADAPGIASVQVDGWRETYGHLLPSRFYDDAELAARTTRWRELLNQDPPPPRLQVADEEGTLVGVAVAGPAQGDDPARELQLYAIYVRLSHHGTGLGARLLEAVLGDEPAQLWVAKDNPRAHAFYRKHGFQPDGHEVADPDLDDLLEVRLVR
ncbi:MAG: GNAT family N-acetyltransferase [Dermatophilaceae bacterium]